MQTIISEKRRYCCIINLTERGCKLRNVLYFLSVFLSSSFSSPFFHSHFKPRLKLISLRNCNYWKGEERFPSRECGYILRDVLQLLNRDRSCFELLEKKIERIAVERIRYVISILVYNDFGRFLTSEIFARYFTDLTFH